MTKGRSIVLGLVIAGLALPAGASAARTTYTLKGKVDGDANSRVSVKVVVRNGQPQRLKGLTYRNLDSDCAAGELSGSGGKNLGASVEFNNSFRWVSYPQGGSRHVNMYGKVRRRGRRITATLEVFDNENLCDAKGKVTLRKV